MSSADRLRPQEDPWAIESQARWPEGVRPFLETLFGADLSGVAVYPSRLPARYGAAALAHGTTVFVLPELLGGDSLLAVYLLAHEIAHTFQQQAGEARPGPDGVCEDFYLENQAHQVGRIAARAWGQTGGGRPDRTSRRRIRRTLGRHPRRLTGRFPFTPAVQCARTKLLVEYKGKKLCIPGIHLLRRIQEIVEAQAESPPPGSGSFADPYKPRTYNHWRGLPANSGDVYYNIGASLCLMNSGQYVYALTNADTGTYSTQNVTQVNPANRSDQMSTRISRSRGYAQLLEMRHDDRGNRVPRTTRPVSGHTPQRGFENWQAMSYPEYVRLLENDAWLMSQEQNTLAWLIRAALYYDEPLHADPHEWAELASQRMDALALTMFGAETIRNRRQLPIQLMFLDLMQARAKYGKNADKGYNIERALSRETTPGRFDTTKGGKLPHMASGTVAEGRDTRFKASDALNQVNTKEISILVHWLEHILITPVYHLDENFADVKKQYHEKNVRNPREFAEVDFSGGLFARADPNGLTQIIDDYFQERCSKLAMMLEKDN